ncbi:hypothetical protein ASPZODRAFT_2054804 [Penicilliopsis zonata CBS 506.65]|uniref:Uncharacterized protein n=1 Tax=Penicilliopsis zonata CBS 506.65 TaxID=1073090 RepID=A0A1L9SGD1_9EURO|nr:hypothetical protein ASPZODRAFT_2054804 [Penicilliopsis zonata CBS 506.65]OJJ46104.1 hypothetical protein ASPZODRAFT_2054804 [Penicilliopsis zonata CBS 506.65]
MSLKEVYQKFLADPRSAPLAPDVSLIYITTTTTVEGAEAVVGHLSRQHNVVKKKAEDVIGAIESADSLCLDVETTLEFVSGGGAYLPSLDDNFLADRVATFPAIHIVRFDAQRRIRQIRLHWDQGMLLKQMEVIGARSRHWPIREAKDQTRLIKSAYAGVGAENGVPASAPAAAAEDRANPISPSKKHIKDPYAADSLFDLLSPKNDRTGAVLPPRAPSSAQPAPREYGELFVGEEESPDATPSKQSRPVAPKAGSKNYQPARIFGDDDTAEEKQSFYKTHPNKFGHFELGGDNSEREVKPTPGRPKSRHISQWQFEDFTTPEKPKRKPRGQEVRHFGWSDEDPELMETPPAHPRVIHPRRDAETHFELAENNGDDDSRRVISSFQNRGMSLYQNHLYRDENDATPVKREEKAPLSVVANGVHRKKDFDSHWVMSDSSPAGDKVNAENKKPISQDQLKHVKMMESSWDKYDESPQAIKTVPATRQNRSKNQPTWGFGDEDDM